MLRSANELKGYTIEATDGDIGEVIQFYFDDEKWTIRYLVADTGGWLMGRRVLISPAALGKVDWNSRKLHVNMNKERVENSPGVDTDRPVSRQHSLDGYQKAWSYSYELIILDVRMPGLLGTEIAAALKQKN
ncbi:MAG TPA: PRC-barrel domain-containing protein, partial [Candidatus Binatia bacterium]